MALTLECLDHSKEEYFEFDSSLEILEISSSSYFSSNSAEDEDDKEDAEPYTLEEGTVPVPFDILIPLKVKSLCAIKETCRYSDSMYFSNGQVSYSDI